MKNILISNYIAQIKDVQNGKLWIGENFTKKIGAISEEEAFVKPNPNMHSVAEIISHLNVWLQDAIIKIEKGRGELLDSDPANWKPVEVLKPLGWEVLKNDFELYQRKVIALVENKSDDFLDMTYYDIDFKGDYPYRFLIEGVLHHNIYHLGQIGIILKLIRE